MVKLETTVGFTRDKHFIRIKEMLQMNHSKYSDDSLTELRDLLRIVPTYVDKYYS